MSKSKTQLSSKEKRDRNHLEQVVTQGIQEAQRQLAEIEQTGIWRSTHRSFKDYCFQRFGFDPTQLDVEALIRLADCFDRASPDAASESKLRENKP